MLRELSFRRLFTLSLVGLFAVACSQSPTSPSKKEETKLQTDTPGMIPVECETLLQQSQQWGFRPGEKWIPQSREQRLEVADFFSRFHLVPEASSNFFRSWMNESLSSSESQAKKRVENLQKALICDVNFTLYFLDGIIANSPKEDKALIRGHLLSFLLNQQGRTSNLLARSASLQIFDKSVRKGYFRGNRKRISELQKQVARSLEAVSFSPTEGEANVHLILEKNMRRDFNLSESIREELAKELPLP